MTGILLKGLFIKDVINQGGRFQKMILLNKLTYLVKVMTKGVKNFKKMMTSLMNGPKDGSAIVCFLA